MLEAAEFEADAATAVLCVALTVGIYATVFCSMVNLIFNRPAGPVFGDFLGLNLAPAVGTLADMATCHVAFEHWELETAIAAKYPPRMLATSIKKSQRYQAPEALTRYVLRLRAHCAAE